MKKILFEELSSEEIKQTAKKSGIVFLPLGSLEYHGAHLPVGLDALVSHEICKAACKKIGGCVIPPLYFGTDIEHKVRGNIMHGMDAKVGKMLPGSIYFLKQNIFYQLIRSIAKNISEQGFRKLIIVSGHSGTGNKLAIEKLSKEKIGNLKIFVFPGKTFPGGIDHAGKIETSLMLETNESLVHIKKIKKPYIGIMGEDPILAKKEYGKKQINSIVKFIQEKIK